VFASRHHIFKAYRLIHAALLLWCSASRNSLWWITAPMPAFAQATFSGGAFSVVSTRHQAMAGG
jgi:hypothetical protein